MSTKLTEKMPEFLNGNKFKAAEHDAQTFLPAQSYAAIRVDGKGFSKFTRSQGYSVPYCEDFRDIMDYTAQELFKFVDGAQFAYVQSDEISVVFTDRQKSNTEWWYGGKVQKVTSLTGSAASVAFARKEWQRTGNFDSTPLFDSRVIPLAGLSDVEEYLRWRRFDAQKNSVSMAASSEFSHRELLGVSSKGRAELLAGSELEVLPDWFYNGRIIYRELVTREGVNRVTGETEESTRRQVTTTPVTREFMETDFQFLLKNGFLDRR